MISFADILKGNILADLLLQTVGLLTLWVRVPREQKQKLSGLHMDN